MCLRQQQRASHYRTHGLCACVLKSTGALAWATCENNRTELPGVLKHEWVTPQRGRCISKVLAARDAHEKRSSNAASRRYGTPHHSSIGVHAHIDYC